MCGKGQIVSFFEEFGSIRLKEEIKINVELCKICVIKRGLINDSLIYDFLPNAGQCIFSTNIHCAGTTDACKQTQKFQSLICYQIFKYLKTLPKSTLSNSLLPKKALIDQWTRQQCQNFCNIQHFVKLNQKYICNCHVIITNMVIRCKIMPF